MVARIVRVGTGGCTRVARGVVTGLVVPHRVYRINATPCQTGCSRPGLLGGPWIGQRRGGPRQQAGHDEFLGDDSEPHVVLHGRKQAGAVSAWTMAAGDQVVDSPPPGPVRANGSEWSPPLPPGAHAAGAPSAGASSRAGADGLPSWCAPRLRRSPIQRRRGLFAEQHLPAALGQLTGPLPPPGWC